MKTNVCKIALMFLIGTALSLWNVTCMQTGMKYRKSVDLTRIRNLRPST